MRRNAYDLAGLLASAGLCGDDQIRFLAALMLGLRDCRDHDLLCDADVAALLHSGLKDEQLLEPCRDETLRKILLRAAAWSQESLAESAKAILDVLQQELLDALTEAAKRRRAATPATTEADAAVPMPAVANADAATVLPGAPAVHADGTGTLPPAPAASGVTAEILEHCAACPATKSCPSSGAAYLSLEYQMTSTRYVVIQMSICWNRDLSCSLYATKKVRFSSVSATSTTRRISWSR